MEPRPKLDILTLREPLTTSTVTGREIHNQTQSAFSDNLLSRAYKIKNTHDDDFLQLRALKAIVVLICKQNRHVFVLLVISVMNNLKKIF